MRVGGLGYNTHPRVVNCGVFTCSNLNCGLLKTKIVFDFIPFAVGGVVLLATSVTGVTDAFTPPLR